MKNRSQRDSRIFIFLYFVESWLIEISAKFCSRQFKNYKTESALQVSRVSKSREVSDASFENLKISFEPTPNINQTTKKIEKICLVDSIKHNQFLKQSKRSVSNTCTKKMSILASIAILLHKYEMFAYVYANNISRLNYKYAKRPSSVFVNEH